MYYIERDFIGLGKIEPLMRDPNLEDRVWNSDSEAFQFMTEEAKGKLAQDPDWYAKGKG